VQLSNRLALGEGLGLASSSLVTTLAKFFSLLHGSILHGLLGGTIPIAFLVKQVIKLRVFDLLFSSIGASDTINVFCFDEDVVLSIEVRIFPVFHAVPFCNVGQHFSTLVIFFDTEIVSRGLRKEEAQESAQTRYSCRGQEQRGKILRDIFEVDSPHDSNHAFSNHHCSTDCGLVLAWHQLEKKEEAAGDAAYRDTSSDTSADVHNQKVLIEGGDQDSANSTERAN